MPLATTTKPSVETKAIARPRRRPWPVVVAETIGLSVVAIFALEGFFSFCGIGGQEFLQPDHDLGCRHIPGKQVTWRLEGYSNDRLSSSGYRDRNRTVAKPAGITRIALLGDSATEGLQVALDETYASVLEKQLNSRYPNTFEVINFACSSYSTGQQVVQFERDVAQYKPDITVLLYSRGDSIENIRKPHDYNCDPRPYFYLDKTGTLQLDRGVLEAQKSKLTPHPVLEYLRTNSRIYGVFSQANLSLGLHEPLYGKIRGPISRAIDALAGISPVKPSAAPYEQQDGWKVTTALLERLNEDCRENGSKLVVMAFPNTLDDPEFLKQCDDLEVLSKRLGFGYLDLTPAFKAVEDRNSLFLSHHFSAPGHKVIARELKNHLEGRSAGPKW